MMSYESDISSLLSSRRRKTYREVGELTGISSSIIHRAERGLPTRLTCEQWRIIAPHVGISIEEIYSLRIRYQLPVDMELWPHRSEAHRSLVDLFERLIRAVDEGRLSALDIEAMGVDPC